MRVIAISPHEAKFCSVNTQTVKTGCRSVEFGPPFISLFDLVISLLEHFLSVPSCEDIGLCIRDTLHTTMYSVTAQIHVLIREYMNTHTYSYCRMYMYMYSIFVSKCS